MNLAKALFLGLIQGLTEFLPISSSGHLVIAQKLLRISKPPVFFDVLVHTGTLLSVFYFFREKLIKLWQEFKTSLKSNQKKIPKEIKLVILGTLPVAISGLLLKNRLETIFDSFIIVGFSLLFTSLVLFTNKMVKSKQKKIKDLKWPKALFIGLAQSVSVLPGVSRSGTTTTAGVWVNLNKEAAFDFSFLLSIPAILGALGLQVIECIKIDGFYWTSGILGLITAFFSGIFALKIFKNFFIKEKLHYFAVYCFLLGSGVLFFSFFFA